MSCELLNVFDLRCPKKPYLIGKLNKVGKFYSFQYASEWLNNQRCFELSGDLPLSKEIKLSGMNGFGAINDSMPDRWGERMIRFLDSPGQMESLDLLYLAGDGRFGSLGFSLTDSYYSPAAPIQNFATIQELFNLIERVNNNERLTEAEKIIIRTTKTMGGAHPKALITENGKEYIAKFPRGSNVDTSLIEHASMVLARKAGINSAKTSTIETMFGHVLLIERFDRDTDIRFHCLSAKTALLNGLNSNLKPLMELSYPGMAEVSRQISTLEILNQTGIELFRRMVFNILIENSDDHEKNHAFMFKNCWQLTPAFDIVPLMSNASTQEMSCGDYGCIQTLENIFSQCEKFGLTIEQAITEFEFVAKVISNWKAEFSLSSVSDKDISYLSDFIDSEERIHLRDLNFSSDLLKLRY